MSYLVTQSVSAKTVPNNFSSEGNYLIYVERVMGIEPTYSAWEADVLPLNYTRRHLNCKHAAPWLTSFPRLVKIPA